MIPGPQIRQRARPWRGQHRIRQLWQGVVAPPQAPAEWRLNLPSRLSASCLFARPAHRLIASMTDNAG